MLIHLVMETDYFSLRLTTLTADLSLTAEQLESSLTAARKSFEDQRRQGADVHQALEIAEATLQETIQPTVQAASRLKDILANDFIQVPALAYPPHFGQLLQQLMPALAGSQTRLTDAYLVGLVLDYQTKHLPDNGI
ncbi:hypothetical protein WBJ53_32915 (plasmid) [Spirosoma sp. SC4-14]|uniref:hypothetical protein n=1 Tax=Spirosoma sp. SC4-14 TaxID=3128900 RepID=UPI0030CE7DF8